MEAHGTARLWAEFCGLDPDGSIDTGFNTAASIGIGSVEDMALYGGRILIAGDFTDYNGQSAGRILMLTSSGTIYSGFDPGTGLNDKGRTLSVAPNGNIYVSGDFSSVDGTTKNGLARLMPDGTVDLSFDPGGGPNDRVNGMVVDAYDDLYLTGWFNEYDGIGRNRIAKVYASPTTTVEEQEVPPMLVHPNPNQGEMTLTCTEWISGTWAELIDPEGRMVGTYEMSGPTNRIDLDLAPGLYLLNLRNRAYVLGSQRVVVH